MLRKLFPILFAALLMPLASAAQQRNVTIKGTTVNGAGKSIELYSYTDPLSLQEQSVDNTVIADDQSFELHAYANYPTLMFLQIENYSQSFYVEPGRTYEVYIPRFDWNLDEQRNIFLSPEVLPLEFLHLPDNELNLAISQFDEFVSQYILDNRTCFDPRFKPQRRCFQEMDSLVRDLLPLENNAYLQRYVDSRLAEMAYQMRIQSRTRLINQYITGKPVLYYDANYMRLFLALYANSISKGSKYVPLVRVATWVHNLQIDTFMDSLGVDPLLRNEQIRELAALQALKEAYYNDRYYNPKQVVRMIELLGQRSRFIEHQRLAQQLVEAFRQQEQGAVVPSFSLPDVDKEMVSLEDFRGKWVYLSFVRVGDPNSIGEVNTLAHFHDSIMAHNQNVEFVTIVCDREFQKMYHFLKNNKHGERYNWTWLHFNNNFKLLEKYRVVSYPTFLLVNPDGELQYNVTPAPSSGFLLRAPWIPQQPRQEKESFLRQLR